MNAKGYIAALSSLMLSVFAIPDLDTLLKFYLGGMVVLISVVINLLFYWTKLREYVVNVIITEIWMELFKKEEFRTLLHKMDKEKKHGRRTR